MLEAEHKENSIDAVRMILLEDQKILNDLLISYFNSLPDFEVLSSYYSGQEVLSELSECRISPTLALLDYKLPDMNGDEVAQQIHVVHPDCKIVFLTAAMSEDEFRGIMGAGYHGVVDKNLALTELAEGLRKVHAGGLFFRLDKLDAGSSVESSDRTAALEAIRLLSSREQDVLRLLAAGDYNKAIGDKLDISARTVEKHRENIKRKLGVHDSAELIRIAVKGELV